MYDYSRSISQQPFQLEPLRNGYALWFAVKFCTVYDAKHTMAPSDGLLWIVLNYKHFRAALGI